MSDLAPDRKLKGAQAPQKSLEARVPGVPAVHARLRWLRERATPARWPRAGWRRLLWVLGAAWAVTLFGAFQPGIMSADSFIQYRQGLAGQYTNWHPPLMSFLMGVAGRLFGSPWPVLLLQVSLFVLLLVSFVTDVHERRRRLAIALFVLCLTLPPVWTTAVTLWKDVWMAEALLLACLCLLRGRYGWGAASMALAMSLRHNALLAVAPLAAALAYKMKEAQPLRHKLLAFWVVILGIFVTSKIPEKILAPSDEWPLGQLLVFDLAAIYKSAPEAGQGRTAAQHMAPQSLGALYSRGGIGPIFWGAPSIPRFSLDFLKDKRSGLTQEWLAVVRAEPALYLQHRWDTFRTLLGIPPEGICYPFHARSDKSVFGFRQPEESVLFMGLDRVRTAARTSVVFRGSAWILASLALLLMGLRRCRRNILSNAILISGLTYAGGYLLIGVACDFRYVYWTVISVFAAAFVRMHEAVPPSTERVALS